jgi:integrase
MTTSVALASCQITIPPQLSGQEGTNRAHGVTNHTGANTDLEAIERWIAFRAANENTRRSYKTHAYRLLIWAISFRSRTLSDLTIDDFGAFFEWLAEPISHPQWGASRLTRGPLSPRSRVQSMTIIQGLFTWLVDGGYLAGNPLRLARFETALLPTPEAGQPSVPQDDQAALDRYLPQDVFDWLRDYAMAQITAARAKFGPNGEGTRKTIRDRFLIEWIYWNAARRSEIPRSVMASIRQVEGVWIWRVVGKGGKVVNMPLEPAAFDALADYRASRGLPREPSPAETQEPVVARLRASDARSFVTSHQIYLSLRAFFRAAALAARETDTQWANTLDSATTHWLRHSYLSHLAQECPDMMFVARRGRHASIQTTKKHYVHTTIVEEAERLRRLRGQGSE